LQLIIALAGLIIGVSVILVTSLFLIFKNNMSEIPIAKEVANEILNTSIWPVVIIGIVVFIVSLWAIVLITHKIYGPLFKLRSYIQKLVNGNTTEEIEFSKWDAIDGLKAIYSDLQRSFKKILHYNYEEMVKIFSELEDILDKIYNKKIRDKQIYDSLQSTCNRLAKALDITSDAIDKEKQ